MTTEPDPHAVPGLDPSSGRTRPLDMSQDPDRFRPDEHPQLVEPAPEVPRGLDPAQDPDRFLPPGQGQTLHDLLGPAGSFDDDRDNYQWVAGLLGVLAFLALVAFLFNSVLTP
jgi:hypothetical protein